MFDIIKKVTNEYSSRSENERILASSLYNFGIEVLKITNKNENKDNLDGCIIDGYVCDTNIELLIMSDESDYSLGVFNENEPVNLNGHYRYKVVSYMENESKIVVTNSPSYCLHDIVYGLEKITYSDKSLLLNVLNNGLDIANPSLDASTISDEVSNFIVGKLLPCFKDKYEIKTYLDSDYQMTYSLQIGKYTFKICYHTKIKHKLLQLSVVGDYGILFALNTLIEDENLELRTKGFINDFLFAYNMEKLTKENKTDFIVDENLIHNKNAIRSYTTIFELIKYFENKNEVYNGNNIFDIKSARNINNTQVKVDFKLGHSTINMTIQTLTFFEFEVVIKHQNQKEIIMFDDTYGLFKYLDKFIEILKCIS